MDWIEVAVDGIPYIQLKHQNTNFVSLSLMQLICAMDLIVKAIIQLYRVFKLDYPYEKDQSIFHQNKPDDKYFKHIRAMFGVHPVNLKDGKERYFASWSTPNLADDFSVIVYSHQVGKESIQHSINISDLVQYTNQRYQLLIDLINHIEDDYDQHLKNYKERQMEITTNVTDEIILLLKENKQRFGEGEAYWYELSELNCLFRSTTF
jgi:hypothetical protein